MSDTKDAILEQGLKLLAKASTADEFATLATKITELEGKPQIDQIRELISSVEIRDGLKDNLKLPEAHVATADTAIHHTLLEAARKVADAATEKARRSAPELQRRKLTWLVVDHDLQAVAPVFAALEGGLRAAKEDLELAVLADEEEPPKRR